MNKKEKKMRLENHIAYFDLVDTIKEMSLNALDQNLSVSDIISVLDRVKVVLLQQDVMVIMEEANSSESEEESEDSNVVEHPQMDIKASASLVDPTALIEEKIRGLYV